MKPIYAYIASGLLLLGGLIFYSQAEQLKNDYYGSSLSFSDCQIGALGDFFGFQPRGVDSSGCNALRNDMNSASTTSNLLFVGSAASLGFGIYLQWSSRRAKGSLE